MNKEELAAKINNAEYPFSLKEDDLRNAKRCGLVVVYGASDDLMELEGAINDECGVYNGGTVVIDAKGVLPDWEQLMGQPEKNDLPSPHIRPITRP